MSRMWVDVVVGVVCYMVVVSALRERVSSEKHLAPKPGVVLWGSYTGPPVPPVLGRRDWANVSYHPLCSGAGW